MLQRMTIIIEAVIDTSRWGFDQNIKEAKLKSAVEMQANSSLTDLHGVHDTLAGVDFVELEYGEPYHE